MWNSDKWKLQCGLVFENQTIEKNNEIFNVKLVEIKFAMRSGLRNPDLKKNQCGLVSETQISKKTRNFLMRNSDKSKLQCDFVSETQIIKKWVNFKA